MSMLRRIFGPMRKKQEAEGNYIIRIFIMSTLYEPMLRLGEL
jgi:hypothetical protein